MTLREPRAYLYGTMRTIILATLALALTACTSTEDLLGSWIGEPEGNLVNAWGVPQRSHETSGAKFIAYDFSNQTRNCVVTFTVQANIVTAWKTQGTCLFW